MTIEKSIFSRFCNSKKAAILSCFVFITRIALGILFIYGGLYKIRQPYDFLSSVYSYELVGPKTGVLVAVILPWLELLVGVCLVGGVFISGALLFTAGMASLFTYTLSSALLSGLNISCGCFGATDQPINYLSVIRTCVIMLLSTAAYICTIFHPHYIIEKTNKRH
ncbi:MAG: MauE/DoxX family redox-associated membrane protein [Planctomycetota bacterium]|jgi:uncharacterized membrane protein YphA (DoxX/SURF4 family)